MPSPSPEDAQQLFFLMQSLQSQGERNETQVQALKVDFAGFKESVNARIEKGEIACETAVETVKSSLRFWGERLTTAEAETEKTQNQLKASDEKLALRIAALETQQKVQITRLQTIMVVISAGWGIFQAVVFVLDLR
ncbi:MAG: hypothetical protein F6J87_18330 [Spirulina sp. SIO3F2]|nr:hypothetical protein [Spirulina sp. SIO3F2]